MMKKILIVVLAFATLTSMTACTTTRTGQGAAAGAVLGGLAGALLDNGNSWRGGAIGAVIGAVAVGTAVELSAQAQREAAIQNRPVVYNSQDYDHKVVAEPIGDYGNGCKEVRTQIFENGRLVREEVKRVCPN